MQWAAGHVPNTSRASPRHYHLPHKAGAGESYRAGGHRETRAKTGPQAVNQRLWNSLPSSLTFKDMATFTCFETNAYRKPRKKTNEKSGRRTACHGGK
jgi:hypothetical protein